MSDDFPPLWRPFETGDLEWPDASARCLAIGAGAAFRPPTEFARAPFLVQGFRPDFLALERRGATVASESQGDAYDLSLVLASRHRGESEARLADAIARTAPGGRVVMAGGKSDGVTSFRKRLAKPVPLGGHLAKNHGEALWLTAGGEAKAWAAEIAQALSAQPPVDGRFHAAPGMFSADHVDAGSRLLADALPNNLKGAAADFCAGWGYLSVSLAERSSGIASVDLYEADHASLEAARHNMAALVPAVPARFHWLDLASEPVDARFDVIVMNPPFHQGRAADPGVGQAMIRAAARALKPGGQLFMVANRGLPYDEPLRKLVRSVTELAADKTFRVWRAKV